MFKFKNIGTFDVAHNIPYCVVPAGVTLKNGYAVTYDETTKTIALPTAETAKKELAVVYNVIDKPELKNLDDYTIEAGEFPRLITLKSIVDQIVVLNEDAITTAYASLAVGDTLVADTTGKWVEGATEGYAQYLEITALVNANGKGIEAKVVIA